MTKYQTLTRIALCWGLTFLATLVSCNDAEAASWTLRQLPPTEDSAPWGPGLSGVSCPTELLCVAASGLDTLAFSQEPTGSVAKWHMVHPASPVGPGKTCVEGEPHCYATGVKLNAASCATTSLCALVGSDGRIFTSTDPFSALDPSGNRRRVRKRPRTILVYAENFWKGAQTRRRRVRAPIRFYSPTQTQGFECKRDRGPYRRCRSPLRCWVGHGRHTLRVRAIGPTGLRGRAAIKRFRVRSPIQHRR